MNNSTQNSNLSMASKKPVFSKSWKFTVNIKTIIHEDQNNESPEYIAQASNRIAALLRSQLPKKMLDSDHEDADYDFIDTIEQMETCTVSTLASDLENGVNAVDVYNEFLRVIYEWASANRVWLGN